MTIRHWLAWALSFAMLAALPTLGSAQADPTVDQIYQAANAGQLPQAQRMVDQVLQKHPGSAKAHYVKAELSARQRDGATAQEELATAERLAPGLSFANPASVQALRAEVRQLASVPAPDLSTRQMGARGEPAAPAPAAAAGLPWGKVAVGVAVLLGALALMRGRRRVSGGAGPSPSGSGPMAGGPLGSTGYGPGQAPGMQPGHGPGPYGASYGPQPGMGSTLGRGLATGLAVGAGAVAAGEIGRRLLHPDGTPVQPDATGDAGWDAAALGGNTDMGGQDFGISDPGASWDSGGGGGLDAGDVGGGDWNT